MRKFLLIVPLVAFAWLDCGDAFAQTGGSPPGRNPQSTPRPDLAQTPDKQTNSNPLVQALNGLSACYRSAMERLHEAMNKVEGEYQKALLQCKGPQANTCVQDAAKQRDAARLPIEQREVDATTIYKNLQSRITTQSQNGGTCDSGGCCVNSQGKTAPAVGPDGRTCNQITSGYGNCDSNFQNILNGY
jgi:hypothetical protein